MPAQKRPRIAVWDLPTRVFHWLLVILIFCAWFSFEFSGKVGDNSLLWHRLNGYAIIVLILWRLIWGITGSPTSRFVNFVRWPWSAARYGIDLLRGREGHFLGHNPLGAYMVLALLAVVATQGVLGLFATEHNFITWGPLSNLVTEAQSETATAYHGWLFNKVLLTLVVLHILANLLYRFVKKDQLIEAMIIGTKPDDDYEDAELTLAKNGSPSPRGSMIRALICLAAAIAIFCGAIIGLGGKLLY